MRDRSIVDFVDQAPSPIAGVMRSDSFLARVARPFINRILPEKETVVRIRSGAARSSYLPIMPKTEKYYWTGAHERHVQDALERTLKPGMRFWDIGAHIGFFTLIAARLVQDSGTVMSFEPMPDTRTRLERTITLNDLRNVTICNIALNNTTGVRTLHPPTNATADADTLHSHEGTPMWTLVPGRGQTAGIPVKCRRLDDLIDLGDPPELLKIDAEGAEIDVLEGGMEFFTQCRATLIVEMSGEEALQRGRALLPKYRFEHLGENHWLLT